MVLYALLAMGLAAMAAAPTCNAATDDEKPSRTVSGQVVTSKELPAVRVELPKEFKHVGSQAFILYGVAKAEQHVFAETGPDGSIKRLYWIQFEGYLPDNSHTYKYKPTKTVEIGGLSFIADAMARNTKSAVGRPDSDGSRLKKLLEEKGLRMASDEVLLQRLVHLPDEKKRNELMIIYMEDLSPHQLKATDLAPTGKAAGKWEAMSKELLDRAVQGVKIKPAS